MSNAELRARAMTTPFVGVALYRLRHWWEPKKLFADLERWESVRGRGGGAESGRGRAERGSGSRLRRSA